MAKALSVEEFEEMFRVTGQPAPSVATLPDLDEVDDVSDEGMSVEAFQRSFAGGAIQVQRRPTPQPFTPAAQQNGREPITQVSLDIQHEDRMKVDSDITADAVTANTVWDADVITALRNEQQNNTLESTEDIKHVIGRWRPPFVDGEIDKTSINYRVSIALNQLLSKDIESRAKTAEQSMNKKLQEDQAEVVRLLREEVAFKNQADQLERILGGDAAEDVGVDESTAEFWRKNADERWVRNLRQLGAQREWEQIQNQPAELTRPPRTLEEGQTQQAEQIARAELQHQATKSLDPLSPMDLIGSLPPTDPRRKKQDAWNALALAMLRNKYPAAATLEQLVADEGVDAEFTIATKAGPGEMDEKEFQALLVLLQHSTKQRSRGFWEKFRESFARGKEGLIKAGVRGARVVAELAGEPGMEEAQRRDEQVFAVIAGNDPIRGEGGVSGLMAEGIYGAAQISPPMILSGAIGGGVGLIAGPIAGSAATTSFWVGMIAPERYWQAREQGMEPGNAAALSMMFSIPEAMIETVQIKGLASGLRRSTIDVGKKAMSQHIKTTAARFVTETGKQITEEAVQKGIELSSKAMADHLAVKGGAGINWKVEFEAAGAEMIEVVKAMPFLIAPSFIAGSGVNVAAMIEAKRLASGIDLAGLELEKAAADLPLTFTKVAPTPPIAEEAAEPAPKAPEAPPVGITPPAAPTEVAEAPVTPTAQPPQPITPEKAAEIAPEVEKAPEKLEVVAEAKAEIGEIKPSQTIAQQTTLAKTIGRAIKRVVFLEPSQVTTQAKLVKQFRKMDPELFGPLAETINKLPSWLPWRKVDIVAIKTDVPGFVKPLIERDRARIEIDIRSRSASAVESTIHEFGHHLYSAMPESFRAEFKKATAHILLSDFVKSPAGKRFADSIEGGLRSDVVDQELFAASFVTWAGKQIGISTSEQFTTAEASRLVDQILSSPTEVTVKATAPKLPADIEAILTELSDIDRVDKNLLFDLADLKDKIPVDSPAATALDRALLSRKAIANLQVQGIERIDLNPTWLRHEAKLAQEIRVIRNMLAQPKAGIEAKAPAEVAPVAKPAPKKKVTVKEVLERKKVEAKKPKVAKRAAEPLPPEGKVPVSQLPTDVGKSLEAVDSEVVEPGPSPTQRQRGAAHAMARELDLVNEKGKPNQDYRNLAKEVTGKTSMAKMTRPEARKFLAALREIQQPSPSEAIGAVPKPKEVHVLDALPRPEKRKLAAIAKTPKGFQRLRRYADRLGSIPKDAQLRKAYVRNLGSAARGIRRQLRKQARLEIKGKEASLVNPFSSARYSLGEAELRSGVPMQERFHTIAHSAARASQEAVDDVTARLKALGKSWFNVALTRKQNTQMADWLFESDKSKKATSLAEMDDQTRQLANLLQDILQGPAAKEIREARWRIWERTDRRLGPEIEKLERQLKTMRDKKSDEAVRINNKLGGLRHRLDIIRPPNAPANVLEAGRTAKTDGKFDEWIGEQTWGTRAHYFLSENEGGDLVEQMMPDGISESIEALPADIGAAPAFSTRSLKTRTGKAKVKKTQSVLNSTMIHYERAKVANAVAEELETFWQDFASADPSTRDIKLMRGFITSMLGTHKEVGLLANLGRKASRLFWRTYFLDPTSSLWFVTRNLVQNIAFGSSQINMIELAKAKAKILTGRFAPGMKAWFNEDWRVKISQKRQLGRQFLLQEEGNIAKQAGNRAVVLVDMVGQAATLSDEVNRILVAPAAFQMGHDNATAFVEGKINYNKLASRLLLDTLHPTQQLVLQRNLRDKNVDAFARQYAEYKTENIHFKYETAFRSALEQTPGGRLLVGLATYPRGAFELAWQGAVKPLARGFATGNGRLIYQGTRNIFFLYMGSALAKRIVWEITGRWAYGLLSTIFSYGPVAPGPSKILDFFDDTQRILSLAEKNQWSASRTAESLVGIWSNNLAMLIPGTDAMISQYEAQNDLKNVKLWRLIKKKALSQWLEDTGRPFNKTSRTTYEKVQRSLWRGAKDPKDVDWWFLWKLPNKDQERERQKKAIKRLGLK